MHALLTSFSLSSWPSVRSSRRTTAYSNPASSAVAAIEGVSSPADDLYIASRRTVSAVAFRQVCASSLNSVPDDDDASDCTLARMVEGRQSCEAVIMRPSAVACGSVVTVTAAVKYFFLMLRRKEFEVEGRGDFM